MESPNNRTFSATVLNDPSTSNVRLRRLDPELTSLAREMIRTLGGSLGAKHGAILIDGIISDFFEASFNMPSRPDAYVEWLHEWLGSLVVARELILGTFPSPGNMGNKQYKIYQALALSILPLLVDSSLWHLPLQNLHGVHEVKTTSSPKVLHGNECVVVALLELTRIFCYFLCQYDMESIMSSILPVVVEKASQDSVDSVNTAALETLKTIGVSVGLENADELVSSHQAILFATMLGRLRLPGGSKIPSQSDVDDITTTANSLRWVLDMVTRTKLENKASAVKTSAKSSVVDLMSVLEHRYDHLFVQKVLKNEDIEDLCYLHRAFFDYFLNIYEVDRDVTYTFKMQGVIESPKQPWLDQLSKFRKCNPDKGLHQDPTPEVNEEVDARETSIDVSETDISLFSRIIARNCYLLSHKLLKIRIKSCEGLLSGFQFLAFVGTVYEVCAVFVFLHIVYMLYYLFIGLTHCFLQFFERTRFIAESRRRATFDSKFNSSSSCRLMAFRQGTSCNSI